MKIKIIFIVLMFLSLKTFPQAKNEIHKFSSYFKQGCLVVEILESSLSEQSQMKKNNSQLKSLCFNLIKILKQTGVYFQVKKEFPNQFKCLETAKFSICKKNMSNPKKIEQFYKRLYEFLKVLHGSNEADFFSLGIQACNLKVILKINNKKMILESIKGLKIAGTRIANKLSWFKKLISNYKLFNSKNKRLNLKEVKREIDKFLLIFL